jgi:hypothetical protein
MTDISYSRLLALLFVLAGILVLYGRRRLAQTATTAIPSVDEAVASHEPASAPAATDAGEQGHDAQAPMS